MTFVKTIQIANIYILEQWNKSIHEMQSCVFPLPLNGDGISKGIHSNRSGHIFQKYGKNAGRMKCAL